MELDRNKRYSLQEAIEFVTTEENDELDEILTNDFGQETATETKETVTE